MPHVVVKLLEGRSDQQKTQLAEQIVKDLVATLSCSEDAVSVAIEDIQQGDWTEQVYKPEIAPNWANLYKKPGYNPFE